MPSRRLCPFRITLALLLFALGAGAPVAVRAIDRYEGLAYPLDGGELAYREVHWRFDEDGVPASLVLYRCPDGAAFARKTVSYAPGATTPDFEFLDARSGAREGVRTRGKRREVFFRASRGEAVKQQALAIEADAIVDEGFDAAVRAHWATLAAGRTLRADFLLPSRFGFIGVALRRDPKRSSPQTLVLDMRIAAWFGFALPATRLTYRAGDHRLQRFEGIGSVRGPRGGRRPVRIEFPDRLRHAAVTRAELDAAAAEPLSGRCGG